MNIQEYKQAFLAEARRLTVRASQALAALRADATNQREAFEVTRFFHNLKGSSSVMGYTAVTAVCAEMEDTFQAAVEGGKPAFPTCLSAAERSFRQIEQALKELENA